jgi:hypothetical protein
MHNRLPERIEALLEYVHESLAVVGAFPFELAFCEGSKSET